MAPTNLYTVITVRNQQQELIGWRWEIATPASIIKTRRLITVSKNNAIKSLQHHSTKFLGFKVPKDRIKEVDMVETEEK